MKNKFVLLTVILWVNTFAVLAQNNKSDGIDTLANKKPALVAPKPAVSIEKPKVDTLANKKPALVAPKPTVLMPALVTPKPAVPVEKTIKADTLVNKKPALVAPKPVEKPIKADTLANKKPALVAPKPAVPIEKPIKADTLANKKPALVAPKPTVPVEKSTKTDTLANKKPALVAPNSAVSVEKSIKADTLANKKPALVAPKSTLPVEKSTNADTLANKKPALVIPKSAIPVEKSTNADTLANKKPVLGTHKSTLPVEKSTNADTLANKKPVLGTPKPAVSVEKSTKADTLANKKPALGTLKSDLPVEKSTKADTLANKKPALVTPKSTVPVEKSTKADTLANKKSALGTPKPAIPVEKSTKADTKSDVFVPIVAVSLEKLNKTDSKSGLLTPAIVYSEPIKSIIMEPAPKMPPGVNYLHRNIFTKLTAPIVYTVPLKFIIMEPAPGIRPDTGYLHRDFFAKLINTDTTLLKKKIANKGRMSMLNARPFPLPEPNSANIQFYHRYWRDIDLKDEKNKSFSIYHAALITILLDAIKAGKLTAYNPDANPDNPTGDAFTRITSYNKLISGLPDTSFIDRFDQDGYNMCRVTKANAFTQKWMLPWCCRKPSFSPDKIIGYRIKEDVYYDKTLTKVVTRVIGVAPLLKLTLSTGELISLQPLCWLKFKDIRKILVTMDINAPSKKVDDSMDDVFLQRRFNARIIEESNAQGLRIKDYKIDPADQELEAKRIEEKIVSFKTTPWIYTLSTENTEPLPTSNMAARKPKKITNIVTAQH